MENGSHLFFKITIAITGISNTGGKVKLLTAGLPTGSSTIAVGDWVNIAGTNAYDSTNVVLNGQAGVAYVLLKDAYSAPVTTGGTVTATATNGATVKITDTASTQTQ
jgi:hypothetical protein